MADGTRSSIKTIDDCLARLTRSDERWEAQQEKTGIHNEKTDQQAKTMRLLLNDISRRLETVETREPQSPFPPMNEFHDAEEGLYPHRRPAESSNRRSSGSSGGHHIKIDMPRFNGDNPRGWLFKVDRFFRYYDFEEQKLLIASVYLDGPVLSWFQWAESNNQLTTWAQFRGLLLQRFGPSPYRDLRGELSKMHQLDSVQSFYNEFEELANQISGIPEQFLQSYFESGLRREIRREVHPLQPSSLVQAFQLAKLMEDRLADSGDPPLQKPA